jgi:hypothetical protein
MHQLDLPVSSRLTLGIYLNAALSGLSLIRPELTCDLRYHTARFVLLTLLCDAGSGPMRLISAPRNHHTALCRFARCRAHRGTRGRCLGTNIGVSPVSWLDPGREAGYIRSLIRSRPEMIMVHRIGTTLCEALFTSDLLTRAPPQPYPQRPRGGQRQLPSPSAVATPCAPPSPP